MGTSERFLCLFFFCLFCVCVLFACVVRARSPHDDMPSWRSPISFASYIRVFCVLFSVFTFLLSYSSISFFFFSVFVRTKYVAMIICLPLHSSSSFFIHYIIFDNIITCTFPIMQTHVLTNLHQTIYISAFCSLGAFS